MNPSNDRGKALEQSKEIDRISDEFEQAFLRAEGPKILDVLEAHPDIPRQALLRELLAIEIELRTKAGEFPSSEQYLGMFPDDKEIVHSLFTHSEELSSTVDGPADTQLEHDGPPPKNFGRYIVLRTLGQGGFGVVYLAHDDRLDRQVAIKVPRRQFFRDNKELQAFVQEARTAAKLRHAGLVTIYDVETHDGRPYIVQEFIEGEHLGDWVRQHQPSFLQIAKIMMDVGNALGYAHEQGLTHCDLKLANVLMDSDARPHVADFGLAVHESVQADRRGQVFGTPHSMAPEQVRGEGHRLDGRTDIWAIGVMLYELLCGRKPFQAGNREELADEIKTRHPRPPRQINRRIPRELERICLKCLSKLQPDRYSSTADLCDELEAWIREAELRSSAGITPQPESTQPGSYAPESTVESAAPPAVIPKGLRSFDAADADFFLQLLPGPCDRFGIPESVRFWLTRIEESDADKTFSVGLLYGPSGCGKSSLVKAGLLSRLSSSLTPIYLEATSQETEQRLHQLMRKHCSWLPSDLSLPDSCAEVRRRAPTRQGKVLLVIDQFEQWLHANPTFEETYLIEALRQCDGSGLQALLLVRDDFFAGVNSVFRQLGVPLQEGRNYALVERFDTEHACKVLSWFGQAYSKLDDPPTDLQKQFVRRAVSELAEEDRVISVRLALFADMMRSRPWTLDSLENVGGIGGLGVTFLEETFSVDSAPPSHRVHEKAIQSVLHSLLPDSLSDIKGSRRSRAQLLEAAGYRDNPEAFAEVIRILDPELRIITPVETREEAESGRGEAGDNYQLTHDYLTPAIREWLAQKKSESRRGRAELKLKERATIWKRIPEKRHLPHFSEWLNIRLFTRSRTWDNDERRMMRNADFAILSQGATRFLIMLPLLVGFALYSLYRNLQLTLDNVELARGSAVSRSLDKLDSLIYPQWITVGNLDTRLSQAEGQKALSLAYALAHLGRVEPEPILSALVNDECGPEEMENIVSALRVSPNDALSSISSQISAAEKSERWNAKARLAILSMHLGDASVAAEMLRTPGQVYEPEPFVSPLVRLREEINLAPASNEARLKQAKYLYYSDRPRESLEILREIQSNTPTTEQLQLEAVSSAALGDDERAGQALEQLRINLESRPQFSSYFNLQQIVVQAWLGNTQSAEQELDKYAATAEKSKNGQYDAACAAAQLSRIAKPNDRTRLATRAIDHLKRAVELGFPAKHLQNDLDLIPLHDLPSFAILASKENLTASNLFDPVQRTTFIEQFPTWSGDVTQLADLLLADAREFDFQSGMSLALGQLNLSTNAEAVLRPVVAKWYQSQSAASRNAADWAMRQWGVSSPEAEPTHHPKGDQLWWQIENLCLVKIAGPSPFWISDREVSVGSFKRFMEEAGTKMRPEDWPGIRNLGGIVNDSHPVQQVSWEDAAMFCNWLSEKNGFTACYTLAELDQPLIVNGQVHQRYSVSLDLASNGFRLPSSAEWEIACRGRTSTRHYCGDSDNSLASYAVIQCSSTAACGSKMCNSFGLFDMHGNVYEWCWDNYSNRGEKVFRGGSYIGDPSLCDSDRIFALPPATRDYVLGFRVARNGDSTEKPNE